MLTLIKAMFKSNKQPAQTAEHTYDLLRNRSSAEIAARLLRRAELHEASAQPYLQRCTSLDRVAADVIQRAEEAHMSPQELAQWLDNRNLCLRLLREGKN